VVTHWFDPDDGQECGPATIRVSGHRLEGPDSATAPTTFSRDETIDDVPSGSGPIALTTQVAGLAPGAWEVRAELLPPSPELSLPRGWQARPVARAAWAWLRWSLSDAPEEPVHTRWEPLAPLAVAPGVVLGSWTLLGLVAAVVGLAGQAALLERDGIPLERYGTVTFFAVVSGLIAAKAWYAYLHPGRRSIARLGGWAVDGFLVTALAVSVGLALMVGLPVGTYLDDSTPGLFLAVAIGRVGCFFAGCCAGRLTPSRWGVWSSDRRVGARRIPTQWLESLAGLSLGIASAGLVVSGVVPVRGIVFIASFLVYALVRQASLRLRAERRAASWRRRANVVIGGG
jgi:phosphatidylglycerol:prolipoprotein diacylglycerol transferase